MNGNWKSVVLPAFQDSRANFVLETWTSFFESEATGVRLKCFAKADDIFYGFTLMSGQLHCVIHVSFGDHAKNKSFTALI